MENRRPTEEERVLGQKACTMGYSHERPWPKSGTLNKQHGCVVGKDPKEAGKASETIT